LSAPTRSRLLHRSAGNGHVGRWNVSHAFYQALGHETNNPIAAQRVDINAQMGALELSIDKDWLRIKGAAFIASGDGDPSDDKAHGSTRSSTSRRSPAAVQPVEPPGLRLAQTGTGLKSPVSLLPSLRTNKDEGSRTSSTPASSSSTAPPTSS
jgi:hypothetical protein